MSRTDGNWCIQATGIRHTTHFACPCFLSFFKPGLLVLTDLLARYLTLLTSTCAKYAQHAGRTNLNARDALEALTDLGVSLEELNNYAATEGKELNRYALYSTRRAEDLLEFRCMLSPFEYKTHFGLLSAQLSEGLRQDHDDAILLEYARCPTPLLGELDSDYEEGSEEESDVEMTQDARLPASQSATDMDVDTIPERIHDLPRKRPPSRPTTPPLPLSPISNPSSPRRKRLRRPDWNPPEYIPDFLPPFPSLSEDTPGSPIDHAPTPSSQPNFPSQALEAALEKSTILPQTLTSAAASDILVQVPYSQSSLASVSERHLPAALPPAPPQQSRQSRLPTLQIEPSLLGAYHHILTHPPPPELPPLNPARHKVALALIKQSQANPRYNPADSLFGTVAPCPPRMATIGPSYPVPINETPGSEKGKETKEKETKLPQSIPRPVAAIDRIAPFISQQTSQIPGLALHVLPVSTSIFTTRLQSKTTLTQPSQLSLRAQAVFPILRFSCAEQKLSLMDLVFPPLGTLIFLLMATLYHLHLLSPKNPATTPIRRNQNLSSQTHVCTQLGTTTRKISEFLLGQA